MSVKPIKPEEAIAKVSFPDEVIEAFNELIVENLRGKSATVKQEDVIQRILIKFGENKDTAEWDYKRKRNEIFEKDWLSVEAIYRTQGWSVSYDKPSYCDSPYEPYFVFKRK